MPEHGVRPRSWARFGRRTATDAVECVDLETPDGAARLAAGGLWFVVADFEAFGRGGRARAWRFAQVGVPDSGTPAGRDAPEAWRGPAAGDWVSSMDRLAYEAAVERVRRHVREGDVYQVNVCRVLGAPLPVGPGGAEPDAGALAARLAAGNPAPYAAAVHVPAGSGVEPVWVVSASPELYLSLGPDADADGWALASGPIKGTARTPGGLTAKDRAENVMITDLVRNDLQRVCWPGTVAVTDLLAVEEHPGLVHLVSRVRGVLADDVAAAPDRWRRVLDATFPPGSVSGAPKSSALRVIDALEPVPRGPYCGAVGWVDADAGRAELAVGIRTFWWERGPHDDGVLRFGTGAGITWGSDPGAEWRETELKAERLVGLASSGGRGLDG
ncbi:chorismate-binding protein [Isoptericola variabilis]|uniref:Anthranilate synthase n=1 Tax=Isoptericola variabilis (strain 225) TaxID=743718 RepID=F6FW20_ISOV2|nr:chorismate-binding protein [Isoptericola variabilis]AEG44490.1 Anthranilate synthase [Isoptericola variabilis 225]TWH26596.1 para-aminobenzoate synthetase component 1 [Isoptericola variabilis J7]